MTTSSWPSDSEDHHFRPAQSIKTEDLNIIEKAFFSFEA
jgi:hypothetical protein